MDNEQIVLEIAKKKRSIAQEKEYIAELERLLITGDTIHSIEGIVSVARDVADAKYSFFHKDVNEIFPNLEGLPTLHHKGGIKKKQGDYTRIAQEIEYNRTHARNDTLELNKKYFLFDYKGATLGIAFVGDLSRDRIEIIRINTVRDDYLSHEVLVQLCLPADKLNSLDNDHVIFKDGPYLDFVNESVFLPILKEKAKCDRMKAIRKLKEQQARFTPTDF